MADALHCRLDDDHVRSRARRIERPAILEVADDGVTADRLERAHLFPRRRRSHQDPDRLPARAQPPADLESQNAGRSRNHDHGWPP
jgi:hypothetical protein